MKIRLVDVDGKIPNYALMKISTYHKMNGDDVEAIYNQHELDLLNQTFELMCKDWKILKECEEDEN